MSRDQQTTRAERDLPAAQRANAEIRAARFREMAAQAVEPRRCISCGASAPKDLQEGEGLPCGH